MPDTISVTTDITDITRHVLGNTKNVVSSSPTDAKLKRGLDSPLELRRGVAEVMNDLKVSPEIAAECRANGHRVRVFSWCPPAKGYLGQQVTMVRWKNIVWNQVKTMISDYAMKQHNGDWQVLDWSYDDDVMRHYDRVTQNGTGPYSQDRRLPEERRAAGTRKTTEVLRHLLLVAVVVDVSGSDDIRFSKKDSTPIEDAPVTARERSIAANQQQLAAQQAAIINKLDSANDTAGLLRQMAQLAAQVDMLQAELSKVSTAPAAKKPSRKRRTTAKKTAAADPVAVDPLPEAASNADLESEILGGDLAE